MRPISNNFNSKYFVVVLINVNYFESEYSLICYFIDHFVSDWGQSIEFSSEKLLSVEIVAISFTLKVSIT